jgi:hypothetical protein
MTSPYERTHSDHRLLSHYDLFPKGERKRKENKKEKKKSPERSFIKLFILQSIGILSDIIVFLSKVSDIGLNNHIKTRRQTDRQIFEKKKIM